MGSEMCIRDRPALLAAGFGVSRTPLRSSSSLSPRNNGILQEAFLRVETPVAFAGKTEMVGADQPRLVFGGASGHGVDLPRIVTRRDGVDALDSLLLHHGLLHSC